MVRFCEHHERRERVRERRAHFQPEAFGSLPCEAHQGACVAARSAIRIRMRPRIGTMLFSLRFAASRGEPATAARGAGASSSPSSTASAPGCRRSCRRARRYLLSCEDHQRRLSKLPPFVIVPRPHPCGDRGRLGRHAAGNHVNGGVVPSVTSTLDGDVRASLDGADRHLGRRDGCWPRRLDKGARSSFGPQLVTSSPMPDGDEQEGCRLQPPARPGRTLRSSRAQARNPVKSAGPRSFPAPPVPPRAARRCSVP